MEALCLLDDQHSFPQEFGICHPMNPQRRPIWHWSPQDLKKKYKGNRQELDKEQEQHWVLKTRPQHFKSTPSRN